MKYAGINRKGFYLHIPATRWSFEAIVNVAWTWPSAYLVVINDDHTKYRLFGFSPKGAVCQNRF